MFSLLFLNKVYFYFNFGKIKISKKGVQLKMVTIDFKHKDEIPLLDFQSESCSDSHFIYLDINKSYFPKIIKENETKEFECFFTIGSEWKQTYHWDIEDTLAEYYDEQVVKGTISLQNGELIVNINPFNYDLNWSKMTIYKGLLDKDQDITNDVKDDFYRMIPSYFNPAEVKKFISESISIGKEDN